MSRYTVVAAGFGLIITVAGCADTPPTGPQANTGDDSPPVLRSLAPYLPFGKMVTFDERMDALGRAVGGFGGVYFEDGQLIVGLKKPERMADQAEAAWVRSGAATFLRELGWKSSKADEMASRIVVRPAEFEFSQLHQWRRSFVNVLNVAGVHMLDTDERRNRIVVGAEDPASVRSSVESLAARIGIPAEAIVIDRMPAVQPLQQPDPGDDLGDRIRPIGGGLMIRHQSWVGSQGYKYCTLMGIVRHVDLGTPDGYRYAATASHCTGAFGDVDFSFNNWYQPTVTSDWSNNIGFEVWDDPLFDHNQNANCPVGDKCRYSDAALIFLTNGDPGPGFEYQVLYPWTFPTPPYIQLIRLSSFESDQQPLLGTTVAKVGATTGFSSGDVTATCTTLTERDGPTLLCQYIALANAGPGDSGSPVFDQDEAAYLGILWGGYTSESGNKYFTFSPGSQVREELGLNTWPSSSVICTSQTTSFGC